MVFAPSPHLSVEVETLHDTSELHVHAGSQGVWQARVIASLGAPVTLIGAFGGETGEVLQHLIARDGVDLIPFEVAARNGGHVYDDRRDEEDALAEVPGGQLSRHEVDGLYESALLEGMKCSTVLLSGPSDGRTLPVELYGRLAADLRANGCRVMADLSGEMLTAVLAGGVDFVKVSHEELLADGRAKDGSVEEIASALHALHEEGAESVVVSRASDPALALLDDVLYEVRVPPLHPINPRGSGDSMTAAVAAGLTGESSLPEAVRLGGAAGALNITRRGLGTIRGENVRSLAERVELHELDAPSR